MKIARIGLAFMIGMLATVQIWADNAVAFRMNNAAFTRVGLHALPPPKTNSSQMNKPGPVSSPDPYFTIKIGASDVYRDALDPTLAYYRPNIHIGKCTGTPLAQGVGDLASKIDGFRFRYYKFESGENPKWADIQVIVVVEKPAEVTLEAVQQSWPDVKRLIPLPYRLDAGTSVSMALPYPPRVATLSQLDASSGSDDQKWYLFSTNIHPTPADLLQSGDNNTLNEVKAKDYASLIISDLSDMPSFQPTLDIRAVYSGWAGQSRFQRMFPNIGRMLIKSPGILPASAVTTPARVINKSIRVPIMKVAGKAIQSKARIPVNDSVIAQPAAEKQISPAIRQIPNAMVRLPLLPVFGMLKPRDDVDYSYSDTQPLTASLPISYPKAKTPNYDYYFLSDSGRFGGPFFEPSPVPNRPQRAEAPASLPGYFWYESHYLGKRLIWPAPREMKLRWDVESGLRPSCRFSTTSGDGGKLTAHITYDLYPDLSTRQLTAAIDELSKSTGEKIDILPFTDLIDANRISFVSGSPILKNLVDTKAITITKLAPKTIDDAWFRVSGDLPVDDWASFTLFMKLGDLGTWDFAIMNGSSSGVAEKASFLLDGDLLHTMGGPIAGTKKSYDAATGGFEVSLDNYGLSSLSIKGLRFLLGGSEQASADVWFDGEGIDLPGVGSASSFDQRDGAGGSIAGSIKQPASPDLKALMDTGKYQSMNVALTPDMVAPSASASAAGGIDPDIAFSFLRSLCYQYIGSSEIIQLPVAPAEASQWADYKSGTIVLRFQGFVYTRELDLSATNKVDMRRLPHEGAYASIGKPGDADMLEYRAIFTTKDSKVVYLPVQPAGESKWLTGDISGVNLDMTQAK